MKTILTLLMFALILPLHAQEHRHRLGAGANYWVPLNDLARDIDDDGFSYFISYQSRPDLIGWDLSVEFLPDRFGEDAIAPQFHFILGRGIYAAAGAGWMHRDGSFADDPFYSLRVGLNFQVLPGLFLDIFGNYRFNDETDLKDEDTKLDTDTVFLGAALRISL
ncbi:MAG: hypothetical protein JJU29_18165 [Verrucomicrobia bacterium]|nr:hypothetical protein [Verrucomicrobiota bacterium]MCH8514440.1 hypothetical protein [Kiritimatiellia bacterium]